MVLETGNLIKLTYEKKGIELTFGQQNLALTVGYGTTVVGGDVYGGSSSTDNAIARYNGTTGKTIQNSGVTIDDNGTVNIPSGQKYKINGTDLAYSDVGAQASNANLTSLSGLAYASASFVKMTGANTFALDTNTYLTGNQTITLGGVLSGSGTTSITASAASGYYMPTTTDQTNWNIAYSDRLKWDGGATGLTPLTGRNSLELGTTSTPQFSQLGLGRANVGSYSLSLNGSLWISAAQAINWAGGNASIEESSYALLFKTYTGSSLTEKMRIAGDGAVQINNTLAIGGATIGTNALAITGNQTNTGLLTLQKADSGAETDLLINPAAKTSGYFQRWQINSADKAWLENSGLFVSYNGYLTYRTTGTTLRTAISGISGSVASAGATTQWSPSFYLRSFAWNTTASASKENSIDMLLKPTSGAATSGDFVIQNNTLDGTANTTQLFKINMTTGTATITGSVISASVTPIAGTTSVAPIVLTSGTNLSTPQSGAFEFDGTNLYFTI